MYAVIRLADEVPRTMSFASKSAIVTAPVPDTVNLVKPDEEAVIKSPTPLLFTTKLAKEVLPDIEATARVPAPALLAVTLNLAEPED